MSFVDKNIADLTLSTLLDHKQKLVEMFSAIKSVEKLVILILFSYMVCNYMMCNSHGFIKSLRISCNM